MSKAREVSLVEKRKGTKDGLRRFLTERAIVRATSQIEEVMEAKGIGRSELAKMLGKTPGWVTQLLDGERNKTLRTIAYVFAVLDMQFETGYTPLVAAAGPREGSLQAASGGISPNPQRVAANHYLHETPPRSGLVAEKALPKQADAMRNPRGRPRAKK
jgi:transcriptional regulator with XRE-family HTH domain